MRRFGMKMDDVGSGAGRFCTRAGGDAEEAGGTGGGVDVRAAPGGCAAGGAGPGAGTAGRGDAASGAAHGRGAGAARTNPRAGADAPRAPDRGGMSIIRRICIADPLRARAIMACPAVTGALGTLARARAGRKLTSLTTIFLASFCALCSAYRPLILAVAAALAASICCCLSCVSHTPTLYSVRQLVGGGSVPSSWSLRMSEKSRRHACCQSSA